MEYLHGPMRASAPTAWNEGHCEIRGGVRSPRPTQSDCQKATPHVIARFAQQTVAIRISLCRFSLKNVAEENGLPRRFAPRNDRNGQVSVGRAYGDRWSTCAGRCTRKGYAASVRLLRRQRLRYGHWPLRHGTKGTARFAAGWGHPSLRSQTVKKPPRMSLRGLRSKPWQSASLYAGFLLKTLQRRTDCRVGLRPPRNDKDGQVIDERTYRVVGVPARADVGIGPYGMERRALRNSRRGEGTPPYAKISVPCVRRQSRRRLRHRNDITEVFQDTAIAGRPPAGPPGNCAE